LLKEDLVLQIASKTGLTYADSKDVVEIILECISDGLRSGQRVELRGFGSFRQRENRARTAYNPQTGERIQIAARRDTYFRPGKILGKLINDGNHDA
jgi:nucleoid DNA-binding protein